MPTVTRQTTNRVAVDIPAMIFIPPPFVILFMFRLKKSPDSNIAPIGQNQPQTILPSISPQNGTESRINQAGNTALKTKFFASPPAPDM